MYRESTFAPANIPLSTLFNRAWPLVAYITSPIKHNRVRKLYIVRIDIDSKYTSEKGS